MGVGRASRPAGVGLQGLGDAQGRPAVCVSSQHVGWGLRGSVLRASTHCSPHPFLRAPDFTPLPPPGPNPLRVFSLLFHFPLALHLGLWGPGLPAPSCPSHSEPH